MSLYSFFFFFILRLFISQEQDLQKPSQESNDFHTVPPLPPPPPPYLPHVEPTLPVIPEAKLEEYVSTNPQPLHKPVTHYPGISIESIFFLKIATEIT